MTTLAIWEPGTASELIDRKEGWERVYEIMLEIERRVDLPNGGYCLWVADTNIAGSIRDLEYLPALILQLGIPNFSPCCTDKVWRLIEAYTVPISRTLH